MESEKYALFDHLIEGVQVIGRDWKYLYVNEAILSQGKFTKEELIGHTMMERYPGIESSDVYRYIQRCMTECAPHTMLNTFLFPNNSTGYFELRIQPVPEGALVLSIDVTEQQKMEKALKQSEERYRMIFNA